MGSWLRLAWQEFWLPFHYVRRGGCPGGRDFVWLTISTALLMTLILLLLATRTGMLNRFVDVLLGNVPGHGVPVWVTNNLLRPGGTVGIDTSILARIQDLGRPVDERPARIPGLAVHPYRSLEQRMLPLVALPGEGIWRNRLADGSRAGPDFDGRAVGRDDPLWRPPPEHTDLPLHIVLNRNLFRDYFDPAAYRAALRQRLPQALWRRLPDRLAAAPDEPLDRLWLEVTVGLRTELLPFSVGWVDRFAVIEPIAFVLPAATLDVLQAAHSYPELRYFPELHGGAGLRIRQIALTLEAEQRERLAAGSGPVHELVSLTGAAQQHYRGELLLRFPVPWPAEWIDACLAPAGIRSDPVETVHGDPLQHTGTAVVVPCGRLPVDVLRDLKLPVDGGDAACRALLDVTARGNGYRFAMVYVPGRDRLGAAVEALLEVADHALAVHPSYEDALNRFGFFSHLLAALEGPYLLVTGLFLVGLIGIQLGVLVGHRRLRYGIFMAKGMPWWQVYGILGTQCALATFLGTGAALALIAAARYYLQATIRDVADLYRQTLALADVNLLPLTAGDCLLSAGLTLACAWLLAALLLAVLPVRRRTAPAVLLQG